LGQFVQADAAMTVANRSMNTRAGFALEAIGSSGGMDRIARGKWCSSKQLRASCGGNLEIERMMNSKAATLVI